MSDLDDFAGFKRHAEQLAPGTSEQIHMLLGCAWGRSIGMTAADQENPCEAKAVQLVVLHQAGYERAVKLCAEHRDIVEKETEPHAG